MAVFVFYSVISLSFCQINKNKKSLAFTAGDFLTDKRSFHKPYLSIQHFICCFHAFCYTWYKVTKYVVSCREQAETAIQQLFPPFLLGCSPAPLKKILSKASNNTPVLRFRLLSRPTFPLVRFDLPLSLKGFLA